MLLHLKVSQQITKIECLWLCYILFKHQNQKISLNYLCSHICFYSIITSRSMPNSVHLLICNTHKEVILYSLKLPAVIQTSVEHRSLRIKPATKITQNMLILLSVLMQCTRKPMLEWLQWSLQTTTALFVCRLILTRCSMLADVLRSSANFVSALVTIYCMCHLDSSFLHRTWKIYPIVTTRLEQ